MGRLAGGTRTGVRTFSRDRYAIEPLTQKKPIGFKPPLLNAAAASGGKSAARASLVPERGQLYVFSAPS